MYRKGKVELAVSGLIIVLILIVPAILYFGVSPSASLDEQVSDVEPYMKSTTVSSNVRNSFIKNIHRESVEIAVSEIIETPISNIDRQEFIEHIENRSAEIADERVSRLEGFENCRLVSDPEYEVNVNDFSHNDSCGIEAEFINTGGPVEVTCEGESSEYKEYVSLEGRITADRLNLEWMFEAVEGLVDEEAIYTRGPRSTDLWEIEEMYEEDFEENRCKKDLEVDLGRVGNDFVWINVSQGDSRLFGEEGLVNQSVSYVVGEGYDHLLEEDEETDEETGEEADEETEEMDRFTGDVNTVAIDPGHGGWDPGVVGPDGLEESEWVLEVSMDYIKPLLEDAGYEVVMTRTEDVYVDINERPAIADRNDADVFLSVHLNGFHDPSAEGAETLYPEGASPELARDIQNSMIEKIDVIDRGIKSRGNLGVLNGCRRRGIDAALIEPAFISNPEENEMIKTDEFKKSVAEGVLEGIKEFDGG